MRTLSITFFQKEWRSKIFNQNQEGLKQETCWDIISLDNDLCWLFFIKQELNSIWYKSEWMTCKLKKNYKNSLEIIEQWFIINGNPCQYKVSAPSAHSCLSCKKNFSPSILLSPLLLIAYSFSFNYTPFHHLYNNYWYWVIKRDLVSLSNSTGVGNYYHIPQVLNLKFTLYIYLCTYKNFSNFCLSTINIWKNPAMERKSDKFLNGMQSPRLWRGLIWGNEW